MIFDVVAMPSIQDTLETSFIIQADDLLKTAFLTAAIEVPLFYICGYRNVRDCIYFAAVNLVSNLLLNEFLAEIETENYWTIVVICEIFVVILEFILCKYWIKTDSKRLLKVLIFTNLVSFLSGVVYYVLF